MSERSTHKNETNQFVKRVWIATGIVALVAVLLLLIKATFNVFLLILAGALVAIYFRGLSDVICRRTKWKQWLCLTLSIVGTFLAVAALSWLIGAKVMAQANELAETLPSTVENARNYLSQSSIGQKVISKISDPATIKKAESVVGSFF